jgi:hypothetical protein
MHLSQIYEMSPKFCVSRRSYSLRLTRASTDHVMTGLGVSLLFHPHVLSDK